MSVRIERKPYSVRKIEGTITSERRRDTRKNEFGLEVKGPVVGQRFAVEQHEEEFGYLVTMRNGTVIRVKDEAELRRLGLTKMTNGAQKGQFGEYDYDELEEQEEMSLESHAQRLIKNAQYSRGMETAIVADIMGRVKPSNAGAV
jgi:hypothetical protein